MHDGPNAVSAVAAGDVVVIHWADGLTTKALVLGCE